ncbi:MAG TPA: hypothetical protein VE134_06865 [Methanomicrobiales archaeon]|nr:hypothetical protein [Methanomicrobiales archaeon]
MGPGGAVPLPPGDTCALALTNYQFLQLDLYHVLWILSCHSKSAGEVREAFTC